LFSGILCVARQHINLTNAGLFNSCHLIYLTHSCNLISSHRTHTHLHKTIKYRL
jgi:hypothetical protein